MRIVFMGTPTFAVPSLEVLLKSPHEVVGVVTQPDRPKGRGQSMEASPVKQLAESHSLPVLQPQKMKRLEFLDALSGWKADVIVVTAFGRILPKVILDLPSLGCVNVHASLLPKYRGAAPIQWAIINGETQTGVTMMLMDEGMDTGPILLQRTLPVDPDETAGELSIRLAHLGGAQLEPILKKLADGTLVPQQQDGTQATLAPLLKKEDGLISWSLTAKELANRVRGLSPWPGCFTFLGPARLAIWKAEVCDSPVTHSKAERVPGRIVDVKNTGLSVETGRGFLKILEVQPANKKRMSVDQFLRGHPLNAGIQFSSSDVPCPDG